MADEMAKDTKAAGNDQPFTPSPGLGMPLSPNTMAKEEAEKLPWGVSIYPLSQEKTSFANAEYDYPQWTLYGGKHGNWFGGKGELRTMILKLVELENHILGEAGGQFLATNIDKKGFARLSVDQEYQKERVEYYLKGQLEKNREGERARAEGRAFWYQANHVKAKALNRNGKVYFAVPGVKQKATRITHWWQNMEDTYDFKDTFVGKLKEKKLMGDFKRLKKDVSWGGGPKKTMVMITNDSSRMLGGNESCPAGSDFSYYIIFTDIEASEIREKMLKIGDSAFNLKEGIPVKDVAELVGKLKGTLVRLGPDALELIDSQTQPQKERSQNETPESREENRKEPTDQDLKDMGLTREEFDLLNTAFADPSHIANIIKKLASSDKPEKVAEILNRMYDHLNPKTAEDMFKQMVDNNPVFSEEEKQKLKETWDKAKTKEEKKKVWETLTSHQAQREAHAKKSKEQKDEIFEEQVNKNPRYGPPGEDTQDRRNRFEEYAKADESQKEKMQEEENERFTTGENANQWGNYFQDNANRESGAGDESVGTETDNNFNGQFSFADTINAINKLKDIGSMKPDGMDEGMKSNRPYWQVVFNHPLTYIFLFIGIIIAIMAAATRKNRS